jgi:CRP-like cAMP-binding protein
MRLAALPDKSTLYDVQLFYGLTCAEIERIHARMRYKTFRKGDAILDIGSKSKAVFLLHTGSVKICDDAAASPSEEQHFLRETVLNVAGPGTWLGEFNAIDGAGHSASVVTLKTSTCFMLDTEDFRGLIEQIPQLQKNFSCHLVRVIRQKTAKIYHLTQQNLAGNLAGNLLFLAEQHGRADEQGHFIIPLPLTHSLLAAMTGHSRESVSITLKYFKSQNWIAAGAEHSFIILNPDALRKYCPPSPLVV